MAKLPRDLPHIKRVRSKGKEYEYFDKGRDHRGKQMLHRLPPRADKAFGGVYAALLGHRSRLASVKSSPTVADLSREYQKHTKFTRRAAGTQETYLVYMRLIEKQIGNAPVAMLERRDVQALIDHLGDKAGAAKMVLLVLRNMWKIALSKEWTTVNPTLHVELPESAEDSDYEPWPEDLLAQALKDEAIGFPVALLYFTGQRIGDVCKMRWSDIQDDETIYVRQEKTGKEVYPPIHSGLAEWLATVPRTFDTMLHGPNGRPRRKATLRGQIQKWASERGHEIVPHGLRKNAVNALLEAGCTVVETASITGQSLLIVEHYAKRRNNRKLGKQAMAKWDRTNPVDGKPEENAA